MIDSTSDPRVEECRRRFIKEKDSLRGKFKITKNTQGDYPIEDEKPIFKKSPKDWTSNQFIRKITYEITGLHTYHAQHNLVILREFLAGCVFNDSLYFDDAPLANGRGNFKKKGKKIFSFDFRPENEPTAKKFLRELDLKTQT